MEYTHMKGKSAIVTGGSGGLGLAIAKRLAASGCNLVVSGRTEARGAEAVEELKMLGAKSVLSRGPGKSMAVSTYWLARVRKALSDQSRSGKCLPLSLRRASRRAFSRVSFPCMPLLTRWK